MFWEGFARSLQGDLMAAGGFLVIIGILYLFLSRLAQNDEVKKQFMMGVAALVLLVLAAVMWRAVSMGAVNRMPRQDVDKSGVYDQMNSHK